MALAAKAPQANNHSRCDGAAGHSRRGFLKQLLLAQAGLMLLPCAAHSASPETSFSFILLGDLHFDRLEHHDLAWLQRDKPDDLRQVNDYSRITRETMPRLFASVRETISGLRRPAFVVQAGDFVEGLCGSEELAVRQNREAVEFIRGANLGVPFLFTKGNHDITSAGAPEAFKSVFHPFLADQTRALGAANCRHDGACYTFEHRDAQFLFFDAYDKESLPWLEAALARRTARHCFVVLHPPVVPYGARSLWHIFSRPQESSRRECLLSLLGRHNAFVLGGHIHRYNLTALLTPGGGRFVQMALGSVVSGPRVKPLNFLRGSAHYNEDQVRVEPEFSPGTEKERRAMYASEAPFVTAFEYADLPGHAVLSINGPHVTAKVYAGATRRAWRTIKLSETLRA